MAWIVIHLRRIASQFVDALACPNRAEVKKGIGGMRLPVTRFEQTVRLIVVADIDHVGMGCG